jgi:hypothetical protein
MEVQEPGSRSCNSWMNLSRIVFHVEVFPRSDVQKRQRLLTEILARESLILEVSLFRELEISELIFH